MFKGNTRMQCLIKFSSDCIKNIHQQHIFQTNVWKLKKNNLEDQESSEYQQIPNE